METTRKIVVGIDTTEISDRALRAALEIAARDGRTEVHAIRVFEPFVDPISAVAVNIDGQLEALTTQLQKSVAAMIAEHGSLSIAAVVGHSVLGTPARCIVALAAQVDADLIVVGTHGRRGVKRALLGSVAEEVLRTAGCPVYCVRPKEHPQGERVPTVEPLCDECAATRARTNNSELWCARHGERHQRAHVYHYEPRSTEAVRPWGFHA